MQVENVSHPALVDTGPVNPADLAGPAGLALALAVAHELHAPVPRAPEVVSAPAPRGAARRGAAARRGSGSGPATLRERPRNVRG